VQLAEPVVSRLGDVTLDDLIDLIADRIAERLGMISSSAIAGPRPVDAVSTELGWTPRHLKRFCRVHGVPLLGTRKRQLVDPALVRQAIAETARVVSRVNEGRIPPPDEDRDLLAQNGVFLADPRHQRKR
jgi:hypothetical protein